MSFSLIISIAVSIVLVPLYLSTLSPELISLPSKYAVSHYARPGAEFPVLDPAVTCPLALEQSHPVSDCQKEFRLKGDT